MSLEQQYATLVASHLAELKVHKANLRHNC